VSTWLKVLRVLERRPEELWAGLGMSWPCGVGEGMEDLRETERRILECLRHSGGEFSGPVWQLAERIGRSERATWKGLRELLDRGKIVKLVSRRGRGQGNTYRLVEVRERRSDGGGR